MRLTLITLFSIFSLIGYGQEIKKVDSKLYEIGTLNVRDDRNHSERSEYWAFSETFKEEKYDRKFESIIFESFETFKKFATLMQDMIDMPDENLVVDSGFSGAFKYRLNKYDWTKDHIYIYNRNEGYTALGKEFVQELNELIETLE